MALIPTFNNGDSLSTIRLQSLNPLITKVNEIDDRLSKSLKTISNIDQQHPTGWYYVEDAGSSGKGKGLLQYFSILDADNNFQYVRQLHFPTGVQGKYDAREWHVNDGHWSVWEDLHSGGFRLEPNPPVAGTNLFHSTSESLAKKARDDYMAANPNDFAKYQLDSLLLIIVSWPDLADVSKKVVVYQNYLNGEWLDTFGHFTSSIDFSSHAISELKDGNRVSNLENTVVTAIECYGSDTDVDLCEGLIENNTIKLSKLRNSSNKYLKLNKAAAEHPVEIQIRPTWHGTFETLAEAIAAIHVDDLIDKETSFIVSSELSNRGRIYYWDAAAKDFLPLHTEGSISAEINGVSVPVDQIKAGDNVTFTEESDGVIKINATASSASLGVKVKNQGETKTVETLNIGTSFGSFDDANSEFILPPNGIIDSSGTNLGEFLEFEEGDGIVLVKDPVNTGRFKISSTVTPSGSTVSVSKDHGTTNVDLNRIFVENEFISVDESTGTLILPPFIALDENGGSLGNINYIKSGTNITLSVGTGMDAGVLTVDSIGGGGSGTIEAVTPSSAGGTYANINKIHVVGDPDLSSVASGELFINLKAYTLESETLDELNTNFPASSYDGRFGVVKSNGFFYWSDGTSWRHWGYYHMAEQVQSLHLRFPEQFVTGTSYSDEASKNLGYQHIPRAIAGKSIDDGGLAIPFAEDGILQSLYKEDLRWVQLFYGLETGNLWSRFYDASNHWHHWKLFGGVEEGHYAVMTTFNDQTLEGYQSSQKHIPYQTVQDPSENIKMEDGIPAVMTKGVYDVTYCIHLSNDTTWPGGVANFHIEARRGDEELVAPAITGSVTAPTTGKDAGKFPAIIAKFEKIPMLVGQKVKLYVTITGDATGIETSTLDPYKNFLVIEPTTSDTKTGINIAKTLHNTLGGVSFTNGYEMRSVPSSDDPLNPRVFGALYNKDFSELPSSTPEIT